MTMFFLRSIRCGSFFKRNICNNLVSFNLLSSKSTEYSEMAIDEILTSDENYNEIAKGCFDLKEIHNCFIIQPFVKWGSKKLPITPKEQLEEAVALIKTLPSWNVENSIAIPLESIEKKKLFGTGNMEKLSQMIKRNGAITAVFINQSYIKKVTTTILYENFQLPILDRYKIVIQILKMHASSKHAKLQVALAELYFIQRNVQKNIQFVVHDKDKLKLVIQKREQKLKKAISEVRLQRKLLRSKRKSLEYPVVAVVGYTNCGKTSLIKALTGEEKLQPRNQLFATLDVTVHEGIMPSGLKVLFVDTVGFISDIPTNLIECFVATLEDALLADIILHVEDLSSTCFEYKRTHVLQTLQQLAKDSEIGDINNKLVTVGNKCDLEHNLSEVSDLMSVSAKTGKGLETFRLKLEEKILQLTSRMKITMRIPNGGDEIRWLYKNSTVVSEEADRDNPELILAKIIITSVNLDRFKHYFIKK